MADRGRLDGPAVEQRLGRLDALLERLEDTPGPTSEAALEAVRTLTEVYGEGLARVRDAADEHVTGRLVDDDLLTHLFVLHDIHPEPLQRRVARALDTLRPALRQRGGDVELAGVDGGVATVRLRLSGCRSTSAAVEDAVREAVLAIAPELSGVRQEAPSGPTTAFVPLGAVGLGRQPVASGEPV